MIRQSEHVFSPAEWEILAGTLSLPPRQRQIAYLLMAGLSDKQIASRLNIKITTVRFHLTRMFAKMGASDRSELIILFFSRFRQRQQRSCQY